MTVIFFFKSIQNEQGDDATKSQEVTGNKREWKTSTLFQNTREVCEQNDRCTYLLLDIAAKRNK